MTNYLEQYFARAHETLNRIQAESGANILKAASAVADAIQNGGLLLLFGSGHSALIAKDAAYRAGGLAPAMTIDDIADGDAERLEGLAKYILARYEPPAGSVIAIISNSGINPVPVEMAMIAKEIGLTTIGITSRSHSQSMPSRHSSGKKLYDLVDIPIDTCGVPGDAAVELASYPFKVGALSTLCGSSIVQAITVETAGMLAERGVEPPIWISANVADGEQHNRSLLEIYRPYLARYQMAWLHGQAGARNDAS